jgi:DNA processing protein
MRPAELRAVASGTAALAAAVVVVEAAEDSGSLSTARAAGGRGGGRVLVVPGAPWDAGAAGCNALIRDGATLVRGLADILEELGAAAAPASASPGGSPAEAAAAGAIAWPGGAVPAGQPAAAWAGGEARRVLAVLVDGQVLGAPRLAAMTGLAPAALAAVLVDLELAGLVRRTAGGVQAVTLPSFPGHEPR